MELLSVIVKVAQEIAKAARTARRNSRRCLELAERAQNVGHLLHDSKVDKDTATRTRVLVSLSEALGDALRLVESCRRGCLFWRLLAASRDAGRFGNVDRRITNCLLELGIANDARREKQFIQITANTRAGSEREINVRNAKKKDVAKNDNKSSSTTAAARKTKNKRRRAGRKGKSTKQKAAGPPPPPCDGEVHYYPPQQYYFVHSVEEDPNSSIPLFYLQQKKINHNTKKDVVMNGNKSSTAAAGERTNKGRYASGKGKQMKEKAAPAQTRRTPISAP